VSGPLGETVRRVAIAGSTGSVGTQALDVVEACPDRFELVALLAGRASEALVRQARALRPRLVVVAKGDEVPVLRAALPSSIEVLAGDEGISALVDVAEVVLNAVVGFAGLPVTLEALGAGRRLALANKESLVAAGPVVRRARERGGGELVPVDSEHAALHQCLRAGRGPQEVARLVVTASGGPFRNRSAAELRDVRVQDALAHPTWRMGAKITVDSSTLMNKGLELIEAHELFDVPYEHLDVLVHPQSVIHALVEFTDGAVIAQLAAADMRLPIGYALGWPERLDRAFSRVDLAQLGRLDFEPPDRERFRCLALAEQAARLGGSAPTWLNAANEVAVAAFLEGRLSWLKIPAVVEEVLGRWDGGMLGGLDDVLEADRTARRHAAEAVASLGEAA
jgi:1-deoxy-D-xylulose-5-phosphate reductoisomerase